MTARTELLQDLRGGVNFPVCKPCDITQRGVNANAYSVQKNQTAPLVVLPAAWGAALLPLLNKDLNITVEKQSGE